MCKQVLRVLAGLGVNRRLDRALEGNVGGLVASKGNRPAMNGCPVVYWAAGGRPA